MNGSEESVPQPGSDAADRHQRLVIPGVEGRLLRRRWSERIRKWAAERREVHVYFDNTAEGHAVRNALTLAKLRGG